MIKRVLAALITVAAVTVLPAAPVFAGTSVSAGGTSVVLPLGNPGCC